MRRPLAIAVLTITFLAAGCCGPYAAAPANAQFLARTELFFGLSRPDGGSVTDQQWRDFLNEAVTPRFPEGLTVFEAQGQWREESGKIAREPSRVLLLIHPPTAEANEKIEQLRTIYKERFHQEAVMRTDTRQRVSF